MNLAQASVIEQPVENILAGDDPILHQSGVLKKGQAFEQYCVIAREKTSLQLVPYDPEGSDGSENAIGVLVHTTDATEKSIPAPYFTSGAFFDTALVWGDTVDTINKRKAAFDRTMIRIVE